MYYKVKPSLTKQSNISTLTYASKMKASPPIHTLLQINLHSNFTHYIIGPSYKQPKCPSAGEWISKLHYIQTMGCYPTIRSTYIILITLKHIMLSKRGQTQREYTASSLFTESFSKGQPNLQYSAEGSSVVTREQRLMQMGSGIYGLWRVTMPISWLCDCIIAMQELPLGETG